MTCACQLYLFWDFNKTYLLHSSEDYDMVRLKPLSIIEVFSTSTSHFLSLLLQLTTIIMFHENKVFEAIVLPY
jgi:hypothetical protein